MASPANKLAILASALSEDVRQAVAMARRGGFDGLLFDAFSSALSFPDLSASGRREFRHLLSSQDREMAGLRLELGPKGLGPGADVDRALHRLRQAIEAAANLQAPLLCVDLGQLPEPPPEEKPRPRVSPEQAGLILLPDAFAAAPAPETTHSRPLPAKLDPTFAAQVDGALAELGQQADRYSVTLALRSELSSLAALERALHQANCPWFGVDLDPVGILHDRWTMDQTFSHLGPLLGHVRARDAALGAERRTQPAMLGRGDIDWQQFLAALEGAAYQGWITVDPTDLPDRPSAAIAAATLLRRTA